MSETYDPNRPCPKCGNPICESEYRLGHHGVSAGWHWGEFGDRIVRRCGRCTHSWYELPLDHDQEAEDAAVDAWLAKREENVEAGFAALAQEFPAEPRRRWWQR